MAACIPHMQRTIHHLSPSHHSLDGKGLTYADGVAVADGLKRNTHLKELRYGNGMHHHCRHSMCSHVCMHQWFFNPSHFLVCALLPSPHLHYWPYSPCAHDHPSLPIWHAIIFNILPGLAHSVSCCHPLSPILKHLTCKEQR